MTEPFDLQGMLAQAQEMQARMLEAQAEAANEAVEGTAGGGLVRVTANGNGEITAVRLDPKAVDPGDVELLEDLLLAALRDVADKVAALGQERLGKLGLGDLGGLLGGN